MQLPALLNALFGGPVSRCSTRLGFSRHRQRQSTTRLRWNCWSCCGLIAFFVLVRLTLRWRSPNAVQQVAEMIHEASAASGADHWPRVRAFPGFCDLHFFVRSVEQSVGLIPGIHGSDHAAHGAAGHWPLLTFLYYNFYGIKDAGTRSGTSSILPARCGGWHG